MAIYASDSGGGSGNDFQPVPEGSHLAVCDMVVDFGLQPSTYMGETKTKHQVYIRWQIPSLRISYEKDGQKIDAPMAIGRTFTLSLSEKSNLRPLLEAWRGQAFTPEELRKFDVTTVLGAPCMITVTHYAKGDGTKGAQVGSAAKLPKGIPAPKLEGEKILYDSEHQGSWDKLRPWMQEKINQQITDEPQKMTGTYGGGFAQQQMMAAAQNAGFTDAELEDEIPF